MFNVPSNSTALAQLHSTCHTNAQELKEEEVVALVTRTPVLYSMKHLIDTFCFHLVLECSCSLFISKF